MPRLKPRRNTTPFDVTLTPAARAILTDEWCTAIDDALDARASMIADGGTIDYLDWFYEQGKSAAKDLPFPGAADLPSYIITENVDTMHAQLLQAVFGVKPFAFVEGWGSSATRAPVVEAFIDWKVRKGTLRAVLDQAVLGALLEDCYILEVRERLETRRIVETIDVAMVTSPQGGAIFGADGTPQMQMGEDGEPVRAQPGEPAVTIERSSIKTKHLGPGYDAISMKDFVYLPGHARTMEQVWGYAYRFWDRLPTIQEKGDDRLYDRAAILELGEQSDREEYSVPRPVDAIPAAQGAAAEKELWQLSIKRDLDEDGREEWYVATLSRKHRTMLRLKLDTFVMQVGRPRCVPIVLFPRRNSVYGYSYAGDKLLTLAEEHTSLRNMKADRGALATNAPFKIRTGALWNPDTQPIGIGRGIPVRSMDEIEMLQIPDVPNSIVEQERAILQAKERVGMLADAAVGVLSTERRTLGENRLVSGGSSVRVRAIIGRLHEAIAAILELTLAHWVEALKADAHGLDAPLAVQQALEGRGMGLPDGRFTADQLTGEFSFEPYGSVESADPQRRQQNFNGGMTALANLAQVFPGLLPVLQNPEAAKAVLEEWLRVHDVRDREPFLQAFAQPMGMPPGLVSGAAPGPQGPPTEATGLPPELMAMMGGGAPAMGGGNGVY